MSVVKLTVMPSYEIFARFYDAVMGDGSEAAKRVSEFIRAAKPDAKKILELGCGTGSILKHLQGSYEVSGLDLSRQMLSIAREKVPGIKLWRSLYSRGRVLTERICCKGPADGCILRTHRGIAARLNS